MATSGRISFTVRSILDLPEQDANSIKQASDHRHSAENYTGSPYRGWIQTDRNHYPYANQRIDSVHSLQDRGNPGWELYKILLNFNNDSAEISRARS
ncbi:hypothetical protein DV515_00002139 [Chloebia gouldiae]|uniref:Uncharacterized protein n=1 Tax=Chloebia gouldiae TaxID=44316 RepID=A0A3L8SWI1_CHLGU|nr:hypothetical protein DV515_00002139 [Chloebia gouldiae]